MIRLQFVILCAAVAVALAQKTGEGKFPCHPNRKLMGADKCEGVTLPANLCSSCPLKPVAANGDFFKCSHIYDLDSPSCKNVLGQYVNLNPCDEKRKWQVNGWTEFDKKSLDYFVYSVCEQCCDCIPKGTVKADYNWMSKKHTDANPVLYKPERGNCPAHAFYDICNIYPSVKYFRLPWGPKHENWPKACPMLRNWFYSEASNNWMGNQNTQMKYELKRFLNNINVANQCKQKNVWEKCRNMEAAQGRV